MKGWKVTGIVATLVIVLAIPLYLIKIKVFDSIESRSVLPAATFVGGRECIDCHRKEYDKWLGSHHDLAMDPANEKSVLGDFNNATLEHDGVISLFFRRDNKFYVHTAGPGGKMADFEVTYVFGFTPLQQYLIPFAGGRLQCLPIAWDTEKKKWFHLFPLVYPNEKILPDNWLYWTNPGQNWNTMCADCHSTNLKKGYDPETDTFNTTWSEIDVNCESCHGPGSLHVEWAELPEMARPQTGNYELVAQTSNLTSKDYIEKICARCHSRRTQLGDHMHSHEGLLDTFIPTILQEDIYFPDGQIMGEVYVYGSFIQSKMYKNDISCRDCHDAHSLQLLEGSNPNDMCFKCHSGDIYDQYQHHFHKSKGEKAEPLKFANGDIVPVGKGAECIECHMVGRLYMGNDLRHDHSFRIPRPDLSIKLKTPNACTQCHRDKSDQWADSQYTKWYGLGRRHHYGTTLYAGYQRDPMALQALEKLVIDELHPVNVRATALSILGRYSGYTNSSLMKRALTDMQPLIRYTAARFYGGYQPDQRLDLIAPLLYDPHKVIRAQAAMNLSTIPVSQFKPPYDDAFQKALREYESSMLYSSDFAFGRFNLGNLYANQGHYQKAVKQYKAAIKIDDHSFQVKNNLALLYNRMGENDNALSLFREAEKISPNNPDLAYSMGLLLYEQKEYSEALRYLEKAARGLPGRARVQYNLGLLYQFLKRDKEAEIFLKTAFALLPDNADFLLALADHFVRKKKFEEAKKYAQQLLAKHPGHPIAKRILDFVNQRID